jgi:hypothetical protein
LPTIRFGDVEVVKGDVKAFAAEVSAKLFSKFGFDVTEVHSRAFFG